MLTHPVSRRRFIGSTSAVAVAAAIPASMAWRNAAQGAELFVSAENLPLPGLPSDAQVLDGPLIERLRTMAANLPRSSSDVVLMLDPADDQLLDIAAQQAGVSVKRGAALNNGQGVSARIIPQERTAA